VQPNRSGTRAAVVEEGEWALGRVLGIAARISGVEDQGFGLVLVVFEEDGPAVAL